MLTNYVTNAVRHLRAHLGHTVVSLLSLTVGLGVSLLVGLWIQQQLRFDAFHEDADRIYRVVTDLVEGGEAARPSVAVTSPPMAPALASTDSGVESAVRVDPWPAGTVQVEDDYFTGDAFFAADAAFFEFFSFPLTKGDPETALAEPNAVVLTRSLKMKYFGDDPALVRSITVGGEDEFTVTGVMADVPDHSHLVFDALVSRRTVVEGGAETSSNWAALSLYTYVKLAPEASASTVGPRIRSLAADNTSSDIRLPLFLQPLTDIHFEPGLGGDIARTQPPRDLYVFGAIALFVLLIACVNYVNLATARSAQRAREVGVRKSLGATRGQLSRQFLAETVTIALLAGLGAYGLAVALLGPFNWIAQSSFAVADLFRPTLLGGMGLAVVAVGILSGGYPAVLLARFSPTDVFRSAGGTTQSSTSRGGWVRQGLVVFQFVVSIVMIVGATVAYQQSQHMQSRDLEIDEENLVVLESSPVPDEQFAESYAALRQELAARPGVRAATASMSVPGVTGTRTISASRQSETGPQETLVTTYAVGPHYTETLNIDVRAGRGFSRPATADSSPQILVNETMARELGWTTPTEAAGQTILLNDVESEIVGVVADFHHRALSAPIEPMALQYDPSQFGYLTARLDGPVTTERVEALRGVWGEFFGDRPMPHFPLADHFAGQYQDQRRLQRAFGWGTLLALLLAGMGLFGLSAFMVARRTGEIGVRKALGATKTRILGLFLRRFGGLVGIAFVLAVPIALVGATRWLQSFPYRVSLTAAPFLGAGAAALALTAAAVGYHVSRAASIDPARTLRQE